MRRGQGHYFTTLVEGSSEPEAPWGLLVRGERWRGLLLRWHAPRQLPKGERAHGARGLVGGISAQQHRIYEYCRAHRTIINHVLDPLHHPRL